ncbi:hypothetical protein BT63DRAFT_467854, partial [Microthyrium microscopicum]
PQHQEYIKRLVHYQRSYRLVGEPIPRLSAPTAKPSAVMSSRHEIAETPEVLSLDVKPRNYEVEIILDPVADPVLPKLTSDAFRCPILEGPHADLMLTVLDKRDKTAIKDSTTTKDISLCPDFPVAMLYKVAPDLQYTHHNNNGGSKLVLPLNSVNQHAMGAIAEWLIEIVNTPTGAELPKLTIEAGTNYSQLLGYYHTFSALYMPDFAAIFEPIMVAYVTYYALTVKEIRDTLRAFPYEHDMVKHVISATKMVLLDKNTPEAKRYGIIAFFEHEHDSLLRNAIRTHRQMEKAWQFTEQDIYRREKREAQQQRNQAAGQNGQRREARDPRPQHQDDRDARPPRHGSGERNGGRRKEEREAPRHPRPPRRKR